MVRPAFDPQPALTGDTLELRPLRQEDFDGLYAAASDPDVWAGHPAKTRHVREVFEGYFRFLLDSGGTLVIVDRRAERIIGCSRYYTAPDQPEGIAIGFTFLNTAWWGGRTNFELKRLMLDHAFATYPEVWFHIDPTNIRSQKATAKLGAEHAYDATLDLSGTPATWMCFRLRKEDWDLVLRENGGLRGFALDPRLEEDSAPVADLPLSAVRLMRDATYPWLVLVPRRPGLAEIVDLDRAGRIALTDEIALCCEALRAQAPCDKLNVAAIGNIVRQLHVHVVARREGDPAWPKPVWGFAPPVPYGPEAEQALVRGLAARLSAGARSD